MTGPADEDPVDVASPACAMREADDAYMGFAGREELILFLAALRAAEGEGSAWGSMIESHLRRLGGDAVMRPGGEAGTGRGPIGAAERLRAMLPRVRDDRLHADLTRMLVAREAVSGQ